SDESAATMPSTDGIHGANGIAPMSAQQTWLRRLYHLPGNADVRMHLLALLLAAGWWSAELLFVAAYFNFRWIARYALVARRQSGPLAPRDRMKEMAQAVQPARPTRQTGMSAPRETVA